MAGVEITYAELLNSLEKARADAAPEEIQAIAKTREDLEIEWSLSDKAVRKRLRILKAAHRLGVCKKEGESIDGNPVMKPAYYILGDEDDNH